MSQVPPPATYQPVGPPKPSSGMSVTALVLGIVSFFTCCVGVRYLNLGMIVAIAAIIVGYMARQKVARGEQSGGGMATAGMILGAVNLILQIIAIVIVLVFGVEIMNWAETKRAELEAQQGSSVIAPSDVAGEPASDELSPSTSPTP